MIGTIELSADQLAQLVTLVLETNGIHASGVGIYDGDNLLGFNRVVIKCDLGKSIEVFPPPKASATREQINELLYPNGTIGNAQFSGVGSAPAQG